MEFGNRNIDGAVRIHFSIKHPNTLLIALRRNCRHPLSNSEKLLARRFRIDDKERDWRERYVG